MKDNQRFAINDVIKSLGIIAVVIGHCVPNQFVHEFVYSHHLALFFFMSGLQLNDQKYAKAPVLLMKNRVKRLWIGFFGYHTFFTLINNLAVQFHLIPGNNYYSLRTMIVRIVRNSVFLGGETLGSALWFVQILLVLLTVFACILYLCTKFVPTYRLVPIILLSSMLGIVGIFLNLNGIELPLHGHTAVLVLPLFLIGYLISLFRLDLNRSLRWFIALPCAGILCYLVLIKGNEIELALEIIGSPWLFYPISLLGIYLMCYIAKVITKFHLPCRFFSFFGKYTFDIMALHVFFFKLVDSVYGHIAGADPTIYSKFPTAYPRFWPIYLLCGVLLPPYVRIFISKCYKKLKGFVQALFLPTDQSIR